MVWNTRPEIRVEASAWIFFSVLVLLLPLNWALAAVAAAAVHELSHFAVLKLQGVRVYSLRIGARGARMNTGFMTEKQEIICAMAGPAGSFSLLVLIHVFPRVALCGLVQGLYNLLPFYPMDGGRAMRCAIGLCRKKKTLQTGERRGTIVLPFSKR